MTIRRSVLVGVFLTVVVTVLLAWSPLGSITADALDKVSVTRAADEATTKVAGSELNVTGASSADIDRSLIGVVTLGAVFLGGAGLIAGVVMVSNRF